MIPAVLGRFDVAAALGALRDREVNYQLADAPVPGWHGNWHLDEHCALIGTEPPGPPVPGGAWEVARSLVAAYEFSDPRIIRAVYRPEGTLLHRDMLLEGRFLGLRFYMGVRVTEVIDETHQGERVWGWAYQTLQGHLEQGKLRYEVVKVLETGQVALRIQAYSRPAPIPNPVVRLGFRLFGRRTQLRFYASVGRRLRASVQAILAGAPPPQPSYTRDGLVVAPSGTTSRQAARLSIDAHHPGE
jgi:uncharacterized protein (UPF0548 family)